MPLCSAIRLACWLWLGGLATIALVAAVTAMGDGAQARELLAFTFPERASVGDLLTVGTNNLALCAALLLAATIRGRQFDVILMLATALNLALAGAALGAYGTRFVVHAGIYGACELAAFSLAVALYLDARRHGRKITVAGAALTALLIVAAAAFETVATAFV